MSTPQDAIAAFPTGEYVTEHLVDDLLHGQMIESRNHPAQTGMELRDWFAARETLNDLDGSDPLELTKEACEVLAGYPKPTPQSPWFEFLQWDASWRAALKYLRADAMMARRARR